MPIFRAAILLALSLTALWPQTAYQHLTALLNQYDPSPNSLLSIESAAGSLLAAPRPTSITDSDWMQWQAAAHKGLGWVLMQRRSLADSEVELVKSLQCSGADGEVAYWLATSITQNPVRKPGWKARSLFYYARAAAYTGPGSLDAAQRKQILAFTAKAFAKVHGSDDAKFKELIELAAGQAFPPTQ